MFGALKHGFRSWATSRRTLNRKEQLRHHAVSLRQYGFLVVNSNEKNKTDMKSTKWAGPGRTPGRIIHSRTHGMTNADQQQVPVYQLMSSSSMCRPRSSTPPYEASEVLTARSPVHWTLIFGHSCCVADFHASPFADVICPSSSLLTTWQRLLLPDVHPWGAENAGMENEGAECAVAGKLRDKCR